MGTEPTNQAVVTDPTNGGAPNTNPANPDAITFTPEQQAKIDQIIRDRQGAAAKDVRAELKRVQDELAAVKASTTTTEPNTSGEPDAKELKRIANERAREAETARTEAQKSKKEADSAREETLKIQKRFEISNAAQKGNFIDTNDVLDLTDKFIRWDSEKAKFIVVNEMGEMRYNLAYQPMSPEEFFTEYATKKPHLVKSDARPGAGSTPNSRSTGTQKHDLDKIFGPKSDAGLANRLAKENPAEYKRLRTQAVETGLLRK